MKKVLFVCLGNICRSPMAEGIFKDKIAKKGLTELWQQDSAGTSRYHIGSQPDPRTLSTLSRHGISFQHAGRQVTSADADAFDYILAMDRANYQDLKNILPSDYNGLYLMRDFDDHHPGSDVPDPYYGGDDGFEQVYQMLNRSLERFLDFAQKQ